MKIHLFFSLGSSPVISKMYVDPSVTGNCPLVIPYPNPYVPPFPAPTLSQPLAQLRQPYIVTLASNAKSSTTKKQSEELKKHDDTKKFYLKPDRSKKEREEYKRLNGVKDRLEQEGKAAEIKYGKLYVEDTCVDQINTENNNFL